MSKGGIQCPVYNTSVLFLCFRLGMMTDETLICPEFDGLWSTKAPSSGPLSPEEGGGGLVGSVGGGGGVREDGQGHKLTMSKMEKVCVCVCACPHVSVSFVLFVPLSCL